MQVVGAALGAGIGIWGGVFPAAVFAVTGAIAGRWLVRRIQASVRDDLSQQRLLFRLAGHHCKLNGVVSERHLAATRALIAKLDLSLAGQREAVSAFNQGKAGLEADLVAARLRRSASNRIYSATLAWWLVQLVRSDAQSLTAEARLQRTISALGLPGWAVRLQRTPEPIAPVARPAPVAQPPSPWVVLGVPPGTQGPALKKAYRRAISAHHPDKVAAAGGSAEAVAAAKHQSQQIQAAWDKIKRHASR